MIRTALLTFSLSVASCGLMPTTTPQEPATATAPMNPVPEHWAFLDLPSIDRLVDSSEDYIGVTLSGDQDTILARAVAGAQRSGWQETRRKEIVDGYKVFFDGAYGS